MKKQKAQLIVALDVGSLGQVRDLVDALADCVDIFKVGSHLFTACGPAAVRFIEARGKKVFLDLKFHDIPNTVASAVKVAVGLSVAVERSMEGVAKKKEQTQGLFMYTVHTVGGVDMMKAAADAAREEAIAIGVARPLAVGVTVLTSEKKTDNVLGQVLERTLMAKKAGLDGVVASCHEAAFLRKEFGQDLVIVTPGIRPAGEATQDQERVATPKAAVDSGSDFLVVGRPIVQATDPVGVARKILAEMG
jgi:orotidine-5'-phosphate decarboxylase